MFLDLPPLHYPVTNEGLYMGFPTNVTILVVTIASWKGSRSSRSYHFFKKKTKIYIYMGVSKNSGTPKWMVYKGNPY